MTTFIKEQVAISGMGCFSAAGQNIEEHNNSIKNAVRNCQQVADWLFETKHSYPVFLCPPNALTENGSNLLRSTSKADKEDLGRTAQLMISAAAEAIIGAGLTISDLHKKRVGITIGTTVGCTFNNESYYQAYRNGEQPHVKPVLDYLNNNLAYRLHTLLGTSGPSLVVTNACASGTDAIGIAGGWIAAGHCDIAIAGGADELSRIAYNGFVSLQLTDSSPCRPFDKTRNGLNLGEGSGIVVLERECDVIDRGRIIGWLRGYGSSSDAWHPTAPHPEGHGLIRAIKTAAEGVGGIENIALINAHGTATRANDQAETNGLAILLNKKEVPIISTKGVTGHTLGAAGGIEAVLTLAGLRDGKVYGTVGCSNIDSKFKLAPLKHNKLTEISGRIGLSQSLAFGGGNSTIVLEAA